MEQARPWHPFRLQGLCGLRGTTFILATLTVIICSIASYLTTELVWEVTSNTTGGNTTSNRTDRQRVKRSTLTLVVPTHGLDEDIITVTEGSNVTFSCNPFLKNCPYCGRPEYEGTSSAEYAQVYFCRHPCKWSEVKAYEHPESYGTDRRFKVVKRSKRGHNKGGMAVVIARVRASDQGKYYCGIDKTGSDWYEALSIVVGKPAPQPVKHLVEPAFEPATKEEAAWMGNEEAARGGMDPTVQKAMAKCQGNKACTLALLQKEELKINTSCWLCLQMSHSWRAAPLTVATLKETRCLIPLQMTEVLTAADDIEKGRIPKRKPGPDCKGTPWDNKSGVMIPPLRVVHTQGDVCVCQLRPRLKLKAGWSDCRIRIDIRNGTANNCTANIDGTLTAFTCPFNRPSDSSPAAVWVCGDRAYHDLPEKGWTGCCYPALMNVGTSVYLPSEEHKGESRKKRSVNILPGALPEKYNGYKLSDPWTTPGANIGWSLFLGVGTAVSINKINGLAWTVMAIANSTENALTMVNDEMKQLRDAVIQNRLVLDMLTSESGGICKMLGTSCCFHIPDYSDNITNIIAHMRMAVKEPERAHDVWGEWLTSMWGGWGYWLCNTVLPIVAVGFLLLLCLPCIFQLISSSVQRLVKSSVSHQMVKLNVYNEDIIMDLSREKTVDEETNSSGSYSEMC